MKQPKFKGTAEQKQQQYSEYRKKWYETMVRKVKEIGTNKPGKPR